MHKGESGGDSFVVVLSLVPDGGLRRLFQLVFALLPPDQSSLCDRVCLVDGQGSLH